MRTTLSRALLCALLLVPVGPLAAEEAEDAEITRMAKEHFKLGQDAFKAGRYGEAIKELKKAYLLKRLPPLLLNIARTYEKLGDVDNEIYYYKKYLAETPPEAKDREQVQQALSDAEARKSGKKPPAAEAEQAPEAAPPQAPPPKPKRPVAPPPEETPPEAPPPTRTKPAAPPVSEEPPPAEKPAAPATPPPAPAPVAAPAPAPTEWTHSAVDSAPPGQPVDVRVQMPVMKGVKVYLYYRGKGQADFTQVEMRRRGPEKVGRIPASEMNGKSIQYYVEAKDEAGTVVKSSGAQTDPNIIMVDPDAPPQIVGKGGAAEPLPGEGEEGAEPAPPRAEAPPKANIEEEAAPLAPKSPKEERAPLIQKPGQKPAQKKVFSTLGWIGVGVAGFGVAAAVGGGLGFFLSAKTNSDIVRDDACPFSAADKMRWDNGEFGYNCIDPNDPSMSRPKPKPEVFDSAEIVPSAYALQEQGKLFDLLGGVSVGVGAAAALAGGALMLVDYMKQHPAPPKAKKAAPPKKRKKVRRPVEEEEEQPAEEAAPPSDDRPEEQTRAPSPIRNFIAAPIVSPSAVGFGAAFSF